MKITQTITMASALLLAAGCAHEERSVRNSENVSPTYSSYPAQTEYNTQNNFSSPAVAGTQSDNTIVAQVRETLQRDPEIAFVVPNIQISANNGAIILSGSVQSEEQKRQILSRVQQVTGVVTVNNQLNVIAGPNGQGNSSDSQLNPTGNSSGSDRLYKDAANGQDNSTNNVLNPTSRDNGASQIYRESNQEENNSSSQGNPGEKAQDQNSNLNTNTNNVQQMP